MTQLEFDRDGFLKDPDQWNEDVARELARTDGIEQLTDLHWKAIHALREHYAQFGTVPAFNHVCWEIGENKYCLPDLFKNAREAWRIAGLPHPGEEFKNYMENFDATGD